MTRTEAAAAPSAPAHAVDGDDVHDGLFVLHGRRLRARLQLEQTSRFADDYWRLEPAQLQGHQSALALNFISLPAAHRSVAKHLCYAMLSGPLPPDEARPSITNIRKNFSELRRFFVWLEGHDPTRRLDELTGADLIEYQRHLLASLASGTARQVARTTVRRLWRWRDALAPAGGGLAFDPRHQRGWGEPNTSTATENATDRIPEPVLGPLITWAMRFVDDFAPDILAADQRRRQIHHRGSSQPDRSTSIAAEVDQTIANYRHRGAPLPGNNGRVNTLFLAQVIGCTRSTLARGYSATIDTAVAELGVDEFSAYDTPITGQLAGRPWTKPIVSHHDAHHGLARLGRHLQIACYIVIAYLSGMRDSEIKHLRRGCLHAERDTAGTVRRWTVTSRAFKGERDPAGVEATWVVGAPAARAIGVLEQLQPADTGWLFAVLRHGPGAGSIDRSSTTTLAGTATINQLNAFTAWVNEHAALHGHTDRIPTVNGQRWRLTTRQFRRTLAWFIARRPGGVIAGAIAYRHHRVQMFEGYAGTSASGFRAEVESEQALARGEHLLTMVERHEHKTLTGPAADEAARRLDDLGANAGFAGVVITDPRRLKRLLARADPQVHPGSYVTCVFDPDKALCLRGATASAPQLHQCRPLDCRNVALTEANANTWHDEIAAIDHQLAARPTLPPLLIDRLRRRQGQITAFLTRNDARADQQR